MVAPFLLKREEREEREGGAVIFLLCLNYAIRRLRDQHIGRASFLHFGYFLALVFYCCKAQGFKHRTDDLYDLYDLFPLQFMI